MGTEIRITYFVKKISFHNYVATLNCSNYVIGNLNNHYLADALQRMALLK